MGLRGATIISLALLTGACLSTYATVAERVVEDRSTDDIFVDNRIVVDVNTAMADVGLVSISTEIYEQRLLVTGIIDDPNDYNDFRSQVDAVSGVKALYWHVIQMSAADQEAQGGNMLSWDDALLLDKSAGTNAYEGAGTASVNYRIGSDSFGTVYVIGRAKSQAELDETLAAVRSTSNLRKLVNYVEIRP
jgi:hyperosmotically inducible protein